MATTPAQFIAGDKQPTGTHDAAKLRAALNEINNIIYAAGAPLGSSNYFAIRTICCTALFKKETDHGARS